LASCLAFADTLFPGTALVGYESGDRLDAARACGFATAGPLRVWLHEGDRGLRRARIGHLAPDHLDPVDQP
jgi:hypothetical protein